MIMKCGVCQKLYNISSFNKSFGFQLKFSKNAVNLNQKKDKNFNKIHQAAISKFWQKSTFFEEKYLFHKKIHLLCKLARKVAKIPT